MYWIEVCDVVFTEKKCQDFLFCLSECEQHYLECYINDPCRALQIPGTIFTKMTLTWKFSRGKKCFKYYTKFECRRNVVSDYRYLRCPVSPTTPLSVTVLFNSMFLDCPLTIFFKTRWNVKFFLSAIGYKLSLNINWFATNINRKNLVMRGSLMGFLF